MLLKCVLKLAHEHHTSAWATLNAVAFIKSNCIFILFGGHPNGHHLTFKL